MARKMAASGKAAGNDRLKIFISYSRRDAAAADAIVAALTERGFDVTIDSRDLPFGEKWQAELAEFIRLSDTVIWLVSEASIKSHWVNWELDEVARRNKRLAPLMVGLVNPAELPRQLGEIHVLPPDRVFDLSRDLDTLVQVLETDRAWLKQASRLQDRAHEWLTKSRASALLLSRAALSDAERWKERRPSKAPAPAQEVMDLLLASRQSANRRQRWVVGGSLLLALGAVALAGFAYIQSQYAEGMAERALESEAEAKIQRRQAETEAGEQRELVKLVLGAAEGDYRLLEPVLADQARRLGDTGSTATALALSLESVTQPSANEASAATAGIFVQLNRLLDMPIDFAHFSHEGPLTSAEFSHDGQRVLTASKDKTARLWDLDGKPLAQFVHEKDVVSAVFSPDGKSVLTASEDQSARLWDLKGNSLARFGHEGWVRSARFSPDGQKVLTASLDGTARLWDLNGLELVRFRHEKGTIGNGVNEAVLSPDYQMVLTACDDYAQLWGLGGKALAKFRHSNGFGVTTVGFSPDGKHVLTASYDNTARVWDLNGKEVARLQHQSHVRAVFSPDGETVLTSTYDAARLWDRKGRVLAQFRIEGGANKAVFTPDGRSVLTASKDGTARMWDMNGHEVARFGHESSVLAAASSPDGQLVLTQSDNAARLWDVKRKVAVRRFPPPLGQVRVEAYLSPDGLKLLTSWGNESARLWDSTGAELARFPHGDEAQFSPDGRTVLTRVNNSARLWNTKGILLARINHEDHLYSPRFSRDGQTVLTASEDKTARLTTSQGQELTRLQHGTVVTSANFSPDESAVLTLSRDSAARLWDRTGKKLAEFRHEKAVNTAVFGPDGKSVLTASEDTTVRLWDVTGRELAVFRHQSAVFNAIFTADGRAVLSMSKDDTARLWDLNGRELTRFDHAKGATTLSPDGMLVLTSSGDTARLWDTSGKQLSVFRDNEIISWAQFGPGGDTVLTVSGSTVRLWDLKGQRLAQINGLGTVHSNEFRPNTNPKQPTVILTTSFAEARLWRVLLSTREIIASAIARAPRCLTQVQRQKYFLPPAPPTWCVERRLWPYDGDGWQAWLPKQKAWLASGRQGEAPALPKAE